MKNKKSPIDLHRLVVDSGNHATVSTGENYAPVVDLHNVNVRRTDDVYQHACNITAWQQLYDQLKPGQFSGQLDECWLDGIQFFKEYTNSALRQSCMVWPKAIWLGIPPPTEMMDGYIGSQAISQQTIAVREGGKEFELNTPDDYTIMGLVVDSDTLIEHINCLYPEQQKQLPFLLDYTTLQVDLQQKQNVCHLIQQALIAGENDPRVTSNRASMTILRQDLLDNLAGLLLTSQRAESHYSATRQNYQRIANRARDYILDHPQDVITVANLCEHLHVSRRTLQNCFHAVWGISPHAYLKAIRLNAVRRELKNSYSQHKTVQDAAMAWGFWHLSQFAIDYHALFGERPSHSLAQRSEFQRYLM